MFVTAFLDYLEQKGFDYVPIMKSGGLNDGYPQFYDFDVDMAVFIVVDSNHFSLLFVRKGMCRFSASVTMDESFPAMLLILFD